MTADEHYQKGMEHFVQDQLEDAVSQLTRAVELEPDHLDSLHALAMSYFHLKDLDKAVQWGERLRDIDPENGMAYTSLSMFYQAQGRIQDAEDMGALAVKYASQED